MLSDLASQRAAASFDLRGVADVTSERQLLSMTRKRKEEEVRPVIIMKVRTVRSDLVPDTTAIWNSGE